MKPLISIRRERVRSRAINYLAAPQPFERGITSFLRRMSPSVRSASREIAQIETRIREIPGVTDVAYGMVGVSRGVHLTEIMYFMPGFFVHTNDQERWADIRSAAHEVAGKPFWARAVLNDVEVTPLREFHLLFG